jgi:adenosylcobinamide kinase / adenosylcobinamide-phosphate guanylyltransferase
MRVLVEGTGGAAGWPQPGCRCASCLRMSGNPRVRSTILINGVVRVGVEGAGAVDADVAGGAGAGGAGAGGAGAGGYRILPISGGWEVTAPDGGRLLYGGIPEEGAAAYDIAFLDLVGEPAQLGLLRARRLVTRDTVTVVAFADHRVSSEGELRRRCGFWRVMLAGDGEEVTTDRSAEKRIDARPAPWRVLVLGGARSGKSEQAELRVAGEPDVTYVATGPGAALPISGGGDPEWAARVAAHRARRPAWWRTAETTDLAGVLAGAPGTLLIDGIGTWLAAAMDECGAWDGSAPGAARLAGRIGGLVGAWRQTRARVVAVSDEAGLGVVPATPAGRLFRDELGRLNQILAAESEEAELVVAGRVVPLGPG